MYAATMRYVTLVRSTDGEILGAFYSEAEALRYREYLHNVPEDEIEHFDLMHTFTEKVSYLVPTSREV